MFQSWSKIGTHFLFKWNYLEITIYDHNMEGNSWTLMSQDQGDFLVRYENDQNS